MQTMQQQRGFTLIELIIVIVILGILAVTAAPRFLDLSDEANAAAAEGVLGSVNAAADTTRAAFLVAGGTGTTVDVDGVTIAVDNDNTGRDGYPAATANGIGLAVDISGQWSGGVGGAGGNSYVFVATPTFPTNGDSDGADCVIYTLTNGEPVATAETTFTFVSGASTCTTP